MPGCGPPEGTLTHAAKGFHLASDRKLPDHSGQHSWLLMELQTSQGGHAGPPGHRWQHLPWVREHQSWSTEGEKEVTWSFMWSTLSTRMHYGKKARGQSQRDTMCMFCSDTSGPAVLLWHVPSRRALLCTVHIHSMEMTSPDGCGLFQQDNVSLPQRRNGSRMVGRPQRPVWDAELASKYHRPIRSYGGWE